MKQAIFSVFRLESAQGVDAEVVRIAWKAQERLHRKLAGMLARGVHDNKAITAVTRELAGFLWAAGRLEGVAPKTAVSKAA